MKPKFTPGNKVFAKVRGYPPWPARVEGLADETPNKMKYHIYFYGTGETAVVKAEDICSFVENKVRLGKPKKHKNFTEALYQIQEELSPEEVETLSKLEEAAQKQPSTPNDNFSDDAKKNASKSKASLSPKAKKRKMEDSLSEDSEKKKANLNNSDSESSGPYKSGEVLSRSGRKIKPRRFADFDDESNEDIKPTCKVSPVVKKENVAEVMKVGFITAEYNNSKYKIPLNLNKPKFDNNVEEEEWNDKVYKFVNSLRKRVESGENIPNLEGEVLDWTRAEANALEERRKVAAEEARVESSAVLKIEAVLLEIDLSIRNSLSIKQADPEKCITLLDKLKDLKLTPLMLKKHPEIVTTIRKIRRYIGVFPPTASKEDEIKFKQNTKTIRDKAEHIYSKFQSLFLVPNDKNFWDFFEEERAKFETKTRHLSNEDIISLIREPEEQEDIGEEE